MSQTQGAMAGTKPMDVPNDFVKMLSFPNNSNFQNGLGYNLQIPGMSPNSSKPEVMGSLLKFMAPPYLLEAHKHFDFWTEEENIRFVNAIESVKFPPDFAIVSARLGNKTTEQCSCYASFYYNALQHHRNQAEKKGISPTFHIKAVDVYSFLGVAPAYQEHLARLAAAKNAPPSSDPLSPPSLSAQTSTTTPPASNPHPSSQAQNPATVTSDNGTGSTTPGLCSSSSGSAPADSSADGPPASSKSSIDFLCGEDEAPHSETLRAVKTEGEDSGAATDKGAKEEEEEDKEEGESGAEGGQERGVARSRVRRVGAGQNPNDKRNQDYDQPSAGVAPPKKKLRAASPPKDKERDIDRNRIPAKDMWDYACMQDGNTVKEEEMAWERQVGAQAAKNPWDWTRKMIVKPSGYAQWWPLFAEYVQLSRRDVSDDMRSIRDKTPGGNTVASRNGDGEEVVERGGGGKKGGKQRKEALHEWVKVGSFVEVKWEGDWWHARVKKIKQERGSDKLDKVFVSYVGGTEDEEEWVPAQPGRMRMPREDVAEKTEPEKPAANKKAKGGSKRR